MFFLTFWSLFMSEIVDLAIKRDERFKQRREMVVECDCGCQLFLITADQEVKCKDCGWELEDYTLSFNNEPN
jgi:hypothetical protein